MHKCKTQWKFIYDPFILPKEYKRYRRLYFDKYWFGVSIQLWWFGFTIGYQPILEIKL